MSITGKKNPKIVVTVILTIFLIIGLCFSTLHVFATQSGIKNNGLDGISINIDAAPYTTFANKPTWGENAYKEKGCAWFASARVYQLTGKDNPIWSGESWYNFGYSSCGFTRGKNEVRAKALACYSNHVSVVEKVNGNTVTISEGGSPYKSDAAHGYCIIRQVSLSQLKAGDSLTGSFLGFVYLGVNPDPDPEPVPAGPTIPDGDYWIVSGIKQDLFLDVSGDTGNVPSKTNVQVWKWGDNMPGEADVYHFQYQDNGYYKILHKLSGLALDVYGAERANGTNAWLYTNYETDAQLWSVHITNTGYKFQSKCNALYLDVTGGTYANGTNVQLYQNNDAPAQRFGLIPYKPNQRPFDNGIYTIHQSANSNFYLDTQGYNGDYKNGSNVQLFTYANDNDLEKYKLEYAGNGYYYITNCTYEGSKNLRVEQAEDGNAFLVRTKNIDVHEASNSRGQLWMITRESNGSYRLWNKLNGYCLDSTGGVLKDRNNIQAYSCNGNDAQKWIFRRVQKDITACSITVSPRSFIYDGTAKTPSVTIKDGNTVLKNGTDYTVTYAGNINPGTGVVNINGKGNYKNAVGVAFTIVDMNVSLDKTSLTLLTNQSQKLNLSGVPSGATVAWTSSNPNVATVDSNGKVTAKTYGKATITATVTAGSQKVSKTCNVQTLFYDVPDESVSGFKQIYWAADKGITKGYNDGEYFGPTKECTRQEFAIFLWRTMGQPDPKGTNLPFSDVSGMTDAGKKAVSWAVKNGIIQGFEDKTFRPNSKVTREQIVIMLWRTAGKPAANKALPFSDTKSYSKTSTSYKAMSWASEKEIIYGFDDNTFRPKDNSKRNQVVIMLYRFVNQ